MKDELRYLEYKFFVKHDKELWEHRNNLTDHIFSHSDINDAIRPSVLKESQILVDKCNARLEEIQRIFGIREYASGEYGTF